MILASQAVLLCRMEQGKVVWSDTIKIERIRCALVKRIHPQNLQSNSKPKSEMKTMVCRFYQRGMCQKDKDRGTGPIFTNMFVPPAFQWEKNIDICLKIAECHLKTSRALSNGSAARCN